MTKCYLAARRAEAVRRRRRGTACLLLVLALVAGCGGKNNNLPPDPAFADQFLMQRGRESLAKKRWIEARE